MTEIFLTIIDILDRFQIVRDMLEKYQENKLTRLWLGPALFVFVNDPELVEQVLCSPNCVEKSFFYKFLRLDKGLLAAKRKLRINRWN
jgi:hypothetical protein